MSSQADTRTTTSNDETTPVAIKEALKPRLRGWLHAGVTPIVLAAGCVLVALAPGTQSRLASIVYSTAALLLFATSAAYHVGTWRPRIRQTFKRIDHANIYLIIAGSYTPVAAYALHGNTRVFMLTGIWVAATLGVLFRVFWTDAPRWLYTGLYVGLGWSVTPFTGNIFATSVAVGVLIVTGGVLYTIGGVVYALKRPNPHPAWFGFHEVFHSFTIAAWTCHYIAISLLIYTS